LAARSARWLNASARERAPLLPRATVAMAFALAAALWAFSSPSAVWLTARTRMPAATAPQMCTTEKPEAPTPSGATEGSAYSLELRPSQTHSKEHELERRAFTWGELERSSPELQADREVVLAAVQQDGWELEFASEELQADREVVLASVRKDGWALDDTLLELRVDREVVLAAVRQSGEALKWAKPEFQADRKVLLTAIDAATPGFALRYASPELRADFAEEKRN
jgi:hypothetical protein